jgi:hypothetical protein
MSERTPKKKSARKHVQIVLPSDVHQRLQQRAKEESLPLSTWVRSLAVKESNKKPVA